MAGDFDGLVMATVNAPWKRTLTAEELAMAVTEARTAQYLSHLASFYGEVAPQLIMRFAKAHAIAPETLSATYLQVRKLTATPNKALEPLLVSLG